ncbi:MAG: GNAT family N-acetyltransferase [bacterium]
MIEFIQVESKEQLRFVRELFDEYVESLGFELDFQDYRKEFDELPGEFAPSEGRLVLVLVDGQSAGCVGLRRMDDAVCEMKRMYVRPDFRGRGIGRGMAELLIEEARKIGYKTMRLDTIDSTREAISLYRSLGFREITPYRFNPMEGAKFFELAL